VADGLGSLIEQLVNRIIRPLDLVMLTRDRIQETLDEAAERGQRSRLRAGPQGAPADRRPARRFRAAPRARSRAAGVRCQANAAIRFRRPARPGRRPRAALGWRRLFVSDLGLRRSHDQPGRRAARVAVAGRAAQGARLRDPPREP
jgi:hypothetical protein